MKIAAIAVACLLAASRIEAQGPELVQQFAPVDVVYRDGGGVSHFPVSLDYEPGGSRLLVERANAVIVLDTQSGERIGDPIRGVQAIYGIPPSNGGTFSYPNGDLLVNDAGAAVGNAVRPLTGVRVQFTGIQALAFPAAGQAVSISGAFAQAWDLSSVTARRTTPQVIGKSVRRVSATGRVGNVGLPVIVLGGQVNSTFGSGGAAGWPEPVVEQAVGLSTDGQIVVGVHYPVRENQARLVAGRTGQLAVLRLVRTTNGQPFGKPLIADDTGDADGMTESGIPCVLFSRDGQTIAAITRPYSPHLSLWSAATGNVLQAGIPLGRPVADRPVELPGGARGFLVKRGLTFSDLVVRDVASGEVIDIYSARTTDFDQGWNVLCRDGCGLFARSPGETVVLSDFLTGQVLCQTPRLAHVERIASSVDGRMFAVVELQTDAVVIGVWRRPEAGVEAIPVAHARLPFGVAVELLAFDPRGRQLAAVVRDYINRTPASGRLHAWSLPPMP